jgi:hypothetical protein
LATYPDSVVVLRNIVAGEVRGMAAIWAPVPMKIDFLLSLDCDAGSRPNNVPETDI